MLSAEIDGIEVAYELVGDGGGRHWTLTPGGRFSKDYGGVRELAEALAAGGDTVLIWDRPNCGASSVAFRGPSESVLHADVLAGLVQQLGFGPAIVAGGSAGSRVSLLAVARHPEIASALAMWWLSGGDHGLVTLAAHYTGTSLLTAWRDGMEGVVALPEWQEVLARNPENRRRFLTMDPAEFVATLDRWGSAYLPRPGQTVPGVDAATLAAIAVPTLVFRSGPGDIHHPRETSEAVAAGIPGARLVEPPWGEDEWRERQRAALPAADGAPGESLFAHWPWLAPMRIECAEEVGAADGSAPD